MSENCVANPLFVKGRFSCLDLASLLLEERYSLAWISVLDCLKRNAPSDRTKVLCRRNDQRIPSTLPGRKSTRLDLLQLI